MHHFLHRRIPAEPHIAELHFQHAHPARRHHGELKLAVVDDDDIDALLLATVEREFLHRPTGRLGRDLLAGNLQCIHAQVFVHANKRRAERFGGDSSDGHMSTKGRKENGSRVHGGDGLNLGRNRSPHDERSNSRESPVGPGGAHEGSRWEAPTNGRRAPTGSRSEWISAPEGRMRNRTRDSCGPSSCAPPGRGFPNPPNRWVRLLTQASHRLPSFAPPVRRGGCNGEVLGAPPTTPCSRDAVPPAHANELGCHGTY